MKFEVVSYRRWGQPKIGRPSALKGLKPSFKVRWNGKLNFNCFVLGEDIYIQHNDFYSGIYQPVKRSHWEDLSYAVNDFNTYIAEDSPIGKRSHKFVYSDCFASIVLRGNAWIRYSGIVSEIKKRVYIGSLWFEMERQQKEWQNSVLGIEGDLSSEDYRFIRVFLSEARRHIYGLA